MVTYELQTVIDVVLYIPCWICTFDVCNFIIQYKLQSSMIKNGICIFQCDTV